MGRLEDAISLAKITDFIQKKKVDDDKKRTCVMIAAIVAGVAVIAAIAYGIYKCLKTDDYDDFEDFEDDFEDFEDFEDDYEEEVIKFSTKEDTE